MALQDKTLTILASEVAVTKVEIQVNDDGSLLIAVRGHTKDDTGNQVGLSHAVGKTDDAAVQAVLDLALTALQQANDLDDSDPVITDINPDKALARAQAALAKARASK